MPQPRPPSHVQLVISVLSPGAGVDGRRVVTKKPSCSLGVGRWPLGKGVFFDGKKAPPRTGQPSNGVSSDQRGGALEIGGRWTRGGVRTQCFVSFDWREGGTGPTSGGLGGRETAWGQPRPLGSPQRGGATRPSQRAHGVAQLPRGRSAPRGVHGAPTMPLLANLPGTGQAK